MRLDQFMQIAIDVEVHRAIERDRQSFGESANDILRRLLISKPAGTPRARPPVAEGAGPDRARAASLRRRGLWSVEIGGRRLPAANLRHAYCLMLGALDAAYPHFLPAFAQEKERSRRFVARAPASLYGRSAHLARHARPLCGGWYYDTNLSAAQVAKRARIAARLCGLFYGSDVRILHNLREI